jgi:hypothetical protein
MLGKQGEPVPIPPMSEEGFLPVGVHECTFAELQATFGQNRWKADPDSERQRQVHCPQRERLCAKLEEYIGALAAAGLEVDVVVDIVVDGSFTTTKPDPSDIDLIVVVLPTSTSATILLGRKSDCSTSRTTV